VSVDIEGIFKKVEFLCLSEYSAERVAFALFVLVIQAKRQREYTDLCIYGI